MTIWRTLIGGAAGLALGGPIGALIGAVAGHASGREPDDESPDGTRSITFTIGVIVLGAKMAKADGHVSLAEVTAFREVFRIPEGELQNVSRVFDRAKREASGFEPYARQLARLFRDDPGVLEELLDALFHIAKADGGLHPAEDDFLYTLAAIFGFDEAAYRRIRAGHVAEGDADPYAVLGVPRTASDEEIKARYRRLVREHHPDTLVAQGLPAEFVGLANAKVAALNDAYDRIRQHRGRA
ncbi:MAG: DnaJ domain-containing protein [Alphaproteobacteria bacterium]|nr:DnaJ domain-containing protein [Alphaproteobacteria bacterium]